MVMVLPGQIHPSCHGLRLYDSNFLMFSFPRIFIPHSLIVYTVCLETPAVGEPTATVSATVVIHIASASVDESTQEISTQAIFQDEKPVRVALASVFRCGKTGAQTAFMEEHCFHWAPIDHFLKSRTESRTNQFTGPKRVPRPSCSWPTRLCRTSSSSCAGAEPRSFPVSRVPGAVQGDSSVDQ